MSTKSEVDTRSIVEQQAEQIARLREIVEHKKAPWVYVPEASKILNKSAITLQRWRCDGYGPQPYYNGRRVVYRRDEIESGAWMLNKPEEASSSAPAPEETTKAPASPISTKPWYLEEPNK